MIKTISKAPVFYIGRFGPSDLVCNCSHCEFNVRFAVEFKTNSNFYIPKFVCLTKYPEYYSNLFEVECAKILCINYTVENFKELFYVQRYPALFYQEIELMMNYENDVKFKVDSVENRKCTFEWFEDDCDAFERRNHFKYSKIFISTDPIENLSFARIEKTEATKCMYLSAIIHQKEEVKSDLPTIALYTEHDCPMNLNIDALEATLYCELEQRLSIRSNYSLSHLECVVRDVASQLISKPQDYEFYSYYPPPLKRRKRS